MTRDEFYSKIEDWINKPQEEWNHITLVAYFYHKYKQKNNVNFMPVRWSGNPASSKECRDIARLFKLFTSEFYEDLPKDAKAKERVKAYSKIYHYINWMFDYKHKQNTEAITTQYFISPHNLNSFELMYSKALKKAKSTDQIKELLDWCKREVPELLENHQISKKDDLLLIKKYIETYSLDSSSKESKLIQKAEKMGLI